METIPLSALQEIVRRGVNGPMFKHEVVKMAAELIELRAKFNKGEDRILEDDGSWGGSLRDRLAGMTTGEVLIIPGIGKRWQVTRVY